MRTISHADSLRGRTRGTVRGILAASLDRPNYVPPRTIKGQFATFVADPSSTELFTAGYENSAGRTYRYFGFDPAAAGETNYSTSCSGGTYASFTCCD